MPELVLHLEGYDGPLDLLLDLARAQKLDLAPISIVALVDQYLAAIAGVTLELAADWLVMAAWLAWLKSRLLLPDNDAVAEEAGQDAAALAARLAELEVVRRVAGWLGARVQLGQEVFARGAAETLTAFDRTGLAADLPSLLRGYIAATTRAASARRYEPRQLTFWTVRDALGRLALVLGRVPAWSVLEAFLPPAVAGHQRRAALASTLLASLEMARGGALALRQAVPFGPILLALTEVAQELAA